LVVVVDIIAIIIAKVIVLTLLGNLVAIFGVLVVFLV